MWTRQNPHSPTGYSTSRVAFCHEAILVPFGASILTITGSIDLAWIWIVFGTVIMAISQWLGASPPTTLPVTDTPMLHLRSRLVCSVRMR